MGERIRFVIDSLDRVNANRWEVDSAIWRPKKRCSLQMTNGPHVLRLWSGGRAIITGGPLPQLCFGHPATPLDPGRPQLDTDFRVCWRQPGSFRKWVPIRRVHNRIDKLTLTRQFGIQFRIFLGGRNLNVIISIHTDREEKVLYWFKRCKG